MAAVIDVLFTSGCSWHVADIGRFVRGGWDRLSTAAGVFEYNMYIFLALALDLVALQACSVGTQIVTNVGTSVCSLF